MAPKAKGGQKYEPTEQDRQTVEAMTAYGIPDREIAAVLGISHETLHKYFKEERATGTAKANAKVAQALYQNAINGNVGAQCFWLKTRARWRENYRVENTGPDGNPIEISNAKRKLAEQLAGNEEE